MKLKIGTILSKLLEEQRVTLKALSKSTGVPSSTIGEWKLNRMPKNPEQVRKVSQFFGVSLHYLLFGEEDREEPFQKILKEEMFSGTFEISIKRVKIN